MDDLGPPPPGLQRRRWRADIGGDDVFGRAADALEHWAVHRGAGLTVATDGDLVAGTNVAMSAPLPIGFVDALCRVVVRIDEPDRFGFAYGTLTNHPERGEESFVVSRADGRARFTVHAVSRPVHPLARLAPPVADALQDRAVARYLAAMKEAVRR
jgi:uncharacterized protein (UPF0548 family)